MDDCINIETLEDLNMIIKKIKEGTKRVGVDIDPSKEILFFGCEGPLPLKYNNIKISDSLIHGKGVFATEDIPKGVIITFYPAHAIINSNKDVHSLIDDQEFLDNLDTYNNLYAFSISSSSSDENDKTIIEPNKLRLIGDPNRISNTLLLGHMINDCSVNVYKDIPFKNLEDLRNFKNAIASYYIKSKKKNCIYETDKNNKIVSIVTTRDIKKDEELLVSYDFGYWFYLTYGYEDEIKTLMCYQMMKLAIIDRNFLGWIITMNDMI